MPYLAPLAAMPTSSRAPRFADMNARPVTQAGIEPRAVRKSEEVRMYFFSTQPMPMTNTT